MKQIFLSFFLLFNLIASANSEESLNAFFNNELSFIQTTLNKINDSFDESSGVLTRNEDNTVKIEIREPFKEIYFISNDGIEIHDLEFNQIKIIKKTDLENNSMFNFINDGFSKEGLNIKEIDDSNYLIEENNKSFYFEFINEKVLHIKYKDNMNIDNLIRFYKCVLGQNIIKDFYSLTNKIINFYLFKNYLHNKN